MTVQEFRLPDPGEGLVEAEIVTWRVAVGDRVEVNDILVEVETSKSLVELPSPYAGTVTALLVSEGDTVDVGNPIISIDDAACAAHPDEQPPERSVPPTEATRGRHHRRGGRGRRRCDAPGGRVAVLVGYGPRTTDAKRRPAQDRPAGVPRRSETHGAGRRTFSTDHAGVAACRRDRRRCRPTRPQPVGAPAAGSRAPPDGSQTGAHRRPSPNRPYASWPRISALILPRSPAPGRAE